jgi:hypothetical protein
VTGHVNRQVHSPSWRSLGDYISLVSRHLRLVAGAVVAVLALGLLLWSVLPREYSSTVVLQVTPPGVGENNPGGGRAPAGVNLDTEAAFLTSAEVVGTVAATLDQDFEATQEAVSLSVPPNSAVLRVRFTADTPDSARQGADLLARTYLGQRGQTYEERRDRLAADQQQSVGSTQGRLAEATTDAAAAEPGSAAEANAQSVVEQITRQLVEQQELLTDISSASVRAGTILREATLPSAASSPDLRAWIGSTLAVGLVVGLGLASWLERGGRSSTGRRELERAGVPVIPLPPGAQPDERALGDLARMVDRGLPRPASIVVTGSEPHLPADDVAFALSRALARLDVPATAVLVDPLRTAAAREAGARHRPGLAEFLTEGGPAAPFLTPADPSGRLTVMGPGSGGPDSRSQLLGPHGRRALDLIAEGTDLVVLAPGSVLDSVATGLASSADAVVLVVPAVRGAAPGVRRALDLLAGTPVVAAVAVVPSVVRRGGDTPARPPVPAAD